MESRPTTMLVVRVSIPAQLLRKQRVVGHGIPTYDNAFNVKYYIRLFLNKNKVLTLGISFSILIAVI